jgi:hypothetical protein
MIPRRGAAGSGTPRHHKFRIFKTNMGKLNEQQKLVCPVAEIVDFFSLCKIQNSKGRAKETYQAKENSPRKFPQIINIRFCFWKLMDGGWECDSLKIRHQEQSRPVVFLFLVLFGPLL